jgi:hypothetical protein
MTRIAKRIFKLLVYTNFIIGISAGIFSAGWTHFHILIEWKSYGVFSFFAALTAYNLDKLWKIQWVEFPSEWLLWIQKNSKPYLAATMLSGFISIYILLFIIEIKNLNGFIILLITSLCAMSYSLPYKKLRLRSIPGIKALIIAIVWMSILGLFPLINEGISSISNFSSILGMFIFYYAITIPFDIRDSNKDDKALKTIPQALGIEKAKYFAISLLLFSYIFATFNYNTRIQILFLGIFIICGLLIFKTTIASQWFHYALIDLCIAGLGLALIFG